MSELLLELFSEEIPARLQARAAKDLERLVNDRLIAAGFMPEGVKAFGGPRRLTLVATGLPVRQPDVTEEKKGPRVGAPDKAVAGFLKSAGLSSIEACETREDKKGAYYVAVIERKGRDTSELIAEFVPEIIGNFPWPKAMRWGSGSADDGALRWVRPLHSILCVFNDEIVDFEVAGIRSGDETAGHRFLAPGKIQARNFEKYSSALQSAKVMLDGEARMEKIAADAQTLVQAQGLGLVDDKGLLAEVAGLAEWPVVMMGTFDEKFLSVPDEALTASMRGHQKYFSVRDPKTKRLANKFVYVANIEAPDGGAAMRIGYERVLTARLSDAWFLYRQDLKIKLEDRIADLDRITFFEGLGSVGDKVKRVAGLAEELATAIGAEAPIARRAALLAKTDLVTGMVYEFPELQGLMGRYYALEQNEDAAVADAIRDHYKPAGQDDDVATAPVSAAVALADKIDTLTAFFAIDKKPTGSSDPFALRRAALGVMLTLLGNEMRVNLAQTIESHITAFKGAIVDGRTDSQVLSELLTFMGDRLKVYLKDKGHRHDQIDAILPTEELTAFSDPFITVRKLEALEAFLKTDDGVNLVAGYKRAANILKAEQKKADLPAGDAASAGRLVESDEKALFDAIVSTEISASEALSEERFEDAMSALASLRAPIDGFFENVTVNADDAALRLNRLALLRRFTDATRKVADLSKLEG